MNKGKPSGFEADTKKDAGAKSSSRARRGQAGAGAEWTGSGRRSETPREADIEVPSRRSGNGGNSSPLKNSPVEGERRIHLEFSDSNAQQVSIAGTFNDWRPGVSKMTSNGDGKWQTDLLLAPGEYEYRLVVDGVWMSDPNGGEERPNGHGSANSVLRVSPIEASDLKIQ